MVPKRAEELLDGGSIYWVIRGEMLCRERILDVRPFVDKDGIGRCRLVLDPKCVPVRPRPYRAFQGWRYLDGQGRAARSRSRRARRGQHAGAAAPRVARARASEAFDQTRDIVDQPGAAELAPRPGAGPGRPLSERDRRQRLGVARLKIVDGKAGLFDLGLRPSPSEAAIGAPSLMPRRACLEHAIQRRRSRPLLRREVRVARRHREAVLLAHRRHADDLRPGCRGRAPSR